MADEPQTNEPTIPSIVSDLAGGMSTASETQNAYWLALALLSFFVIIPTYHAAVPGTPAYYELPFSLPGLDPKWFSCVSLLVLSGLIVAFAAAEANLVKSQVLARRTIHDIWGWGDDGKRQMAYLDELRKPSLTHVSSMTRNIVLYPFIKTMVLAVWIGLPGAALWFAASRFFGSRLTLHGVFWTRLMWLVCAAAMVAAFLALFYAALHELRYVFGAQSPLRHAPRGPIAQTQAAEPGAAAPVPGGADASVAEAGGGAGGE